jgi:hypothetical protein
MSYCWTALSRHVLARPGGSSLAMLSPAISVASGLGPCPSTATTRRMVTVAMVRFGLGASPRPTRGVHRAGKRIVLV